MPLTPNAKTEQDINIQAIRRKVENRKFRFLQKDCHFPQTNARTLANRFLDDRSANVLASLMLVVATRTRVRVMNETIMLSFLPTFVGTGFLKTKFSSVSTTVLATLCPPRKITTPKEFPATFAFCGSPHDVVVARTREPKSKNHHAIHSF